MCLGSTVVWWLTPLPHSERVPGLNPGWGLYVWSLDVLPMYAWVCYEYSSFLPLPKNMHVRLIGHSKLTLGVSVPIESGEKTEDFCVLKNATTSEHLQNMCEKWLL